MSFYRYVALLCRRTGRRGAALAYYLRAALRDRRYLATGLAGDLADMAAGALRVVWRAVPGRSDHGRGDQWRAAGAAWLDEFADAYPAPGTSTVDA